jgi:hypothetical protein
MGGEMKPQFGRRVPAGRLLVAALLAISVAFSITASRADSDIASYAPVKHPEGRIERADRTQPIINDPVPQHGMVHEWTTFVSTGFTAWIIDFDNRTIVRLSGAVATKPSGERVTSLVNRVSRHLEDAELNQLIVQANEVWNPTSSPERGPMITDLFSTLSLYDGADVTKSTLQGSNSAATVIKTIESLQLPPS